jgi:hypothetical protein
MQFATHALCSRFIRMACASIARFARAFISICKAYFLSVFLQINYIIFGEFAANFKFSYSQGYLPLCESSINKGKLVFIVFVI